MTSKLSGRQLVALSKKLKGDADRLLAWSGVLSILGRHGEAKLTGSYPVGLMAHGDIDVHIVRKKLFTKAEVLGILTNIISTTMFTSYFFGDWYKSGKDPRFPHGYYIGLKVVYRGRKWKIDLWFMSHMEQNRQNRDRLDIADTELTDAQKITILQLKQYLGNTGITMSGQKVYEAVLVHGITTIAGFKKWMRG
ncbi:MAG: hypothetical protein WCT02_01140 [Candidatus Paceibacterota bacterium]